MQEEEKIELDFEISEKDFKRFKRIQRFLKREQGKEISFNDILHGVIIKSLDYYSEKV